eukprot:gene10068-1818_t
MAPCHPSPAATANAALPLRPINAGAYQLRTGSTGAVVYGARFNGGSGYRNDRTFGVPTGDDVWQPQALKLATAYELHCLRLKCIMEPAGKCCFDYGNAETDNHDDGAGTMEALYWGNGSLTQLMHHGTGQGPWVMVDLENGVWAGKGEISNPTNVPVEADFVTAVLKGKPGGFALKGGNAQAGALTTLYEGPRPSFQRYNPMKKQGALILGIGGDNSNRGVGTFIEGAVTAGYSSDDTDDAIQANIVSAQYSH